jgi:hypothetical protein
MVRQTILPDLDLPKPNLNSLNCQTDRIAKQIILPKGLNCQRDRRFGEIAESNCQTELPKGLPNLNSFWENAELNCQRDRLFG